MITFDFETKSYADLKKVGAWAYSEDPSTEVICAAYKIDDGPIQTWWPGKELKGEQEPPLGLSVCPYPEMPHDLRFALATGHTIEAHNVAFERAIWMNVMVPRFGWLLPKDDQWRDTMAVAHYYALPGALGRLATVLGLGSKDTAGGRLITKYSKLHLKTAKMEIPEEDFKSFVAYCVKDVEVEHAVSEFLGDLPERELPVFQLDQKINLRGLHLDLPGIAAATKIVEQRNADLTKEFRELTELNPTQTAKVIDWARGNGVELENLQAAYLRDALDDDMPSGPVRRAISIRLEINKASTKKLDAMSRQCGSDGRARFQTRYHGAVTGRWTGSGFQPLNLNRGFDGVDPEQLVRDILYGDADWLDTLYGDATDAIAKASRHWIMAAPGNKIIAGDFASIEAVILACLSGEEWKVDAFQRGDNIYERTAEKIHKLPVGSVTKATHPAERHDGKTCLGASTQVLTQGGWKLIVDISSKDQLWDGQEWVKHGGLVCQGQKQTLNLAGVSMTPDHLVLAGGRWSEAQTVATCERLLRRALESASGASPSRASRGASAEGFSGCGLGAAAARNRILWRKATYGVAKLLAAPLAHATSQLSGARITLATLISALTRSIGAAYSTGFPRACRAVGQGSEGTKITELEASLCGPRGLQAQKAEGSFSRIFFRCLAGINRSLRSTASTQTTTTSRGTSGSLRALRTLKTNAASQTFSRASTQLQNVYDIANAGPRKCFTIRTNEGPLIVHNCELAFGYQGALGAWLKFDNSGRHSDDRIIEFCKAWRAEHPKTVAFWGDLRWAAIQAVQTGKRQQVGLIGFELVDEWLSMILPNGKRIWYWNPDIRPCRPRWCKPASETKCAEGTCGHQPELVLSYMAQKEGQWKRVQTYGGKLAENACQATSREILVPAMIRAEEAGYKIILTVYDEIVAEVPEDFGSAEEFAGIMAGPLPEWAKDWPVRVEPWEGQRYKK